MRAALFVIVAAFSGACAMADNGVAVGDDAPDADPSAPDAARTIDGPPQPIDGPPTPMAVTLSQSTATTITTMNTLACGNVNSTVENHYYRVFKLSDFGIATTFTATHVDFGVENAATASTVVNSQTVMVRLWTLSGTTPLVANMALLYGQNVIVSDATLTVLGVDLTAPVVVPAGSTLVLELFSPGSTTTGDFFYPGSNTAGESGPSYIRAPVAAPDGCAITEPTPYTTIDNTVMVHLVLSVSGTKP